MTAKILLLIIFLAALLRFYHLTVNPPHLYWDEAAIAYNAYSINLTGKDEWGIAAPLIFRSFNDYKLPLFVYVVTASQRFFGLTDFAVRFPSALAGVLTVFFVFFLVKELLSLIPKKLPQNMVALLAAFLLAIAPWHLQFSRAGFEANLALFFRVMAIWLFLVAVRKNTKLLFLSLFFFTAALYTYHSAAITAPLILGLLLLLFACKLFRSWKLTLTALVFFTILVAPYLPSYLFSANGRVRLTSESVFNMKGNVVTNFVNNYVANFSLDYLFFHGDQGGRHSVKKLGELYLWQLPTILAGLYFLLRYPSKASAIIIGWLLIAALPPALTTVSPHALRGLLAVRSWQTVSAIGLVFIFIHLGGKKTWFLWPTIFVVGYALFLYLHVYYFHYPKAYAADWQDGRRQTVEYVKKIQDSYDKIFVEKSFGQIYLLLYLPYPPEELQASNHDLTRLGKFVYFDVNSFPAKGSPTEKDLTVAPPWMLPKDREVIREIKTAGGDPAFEVYEY